MEQFRDYLITDRTEADAARAQYLRSLWGPAPGQWRGTAGELAEWEAGLKGAYNAADLNRVTLAANYLLAKLAEAGYRVPEGTFPAHLISVAVDPPGSGTARGALFYRGDPATVRAEPIGGSKFLRWEENGETVSEDPVFTLTADGDRNLTAHFEAEWVKRTSIVGAGRIGFARLGWGYSDAIQST